LEPCSSIITLSVFHAIRVLKFMKEAVTASFLLVGTRNQVAWAEEIKGFE